MNSEKIKISAVNYWNTIPFQYAIDRHLSDDDRFDISWDIPADCASKLQRGIVDIGLIPVAFLPRIPNGRRIVDYGIAADGEVYSVALYADVPLDQITEIILDYQSRTSVRLCRILASEFWKIQPSFRPAEPGFEQSGRGTSAVVVIGDRTFGLEKDYNFKWDLAQEWKAWTGMSFVFAVWAANREISNDIADTLSRVFDWGLRHISESIAWKKTQIDLPENIQSYLTEKIHFRIDQEKQRGMREYLKWVELLQL